MAKQDKNIDYSMFDGSSDKDQTTSKQPEEKGVDYSMFDKKDMLDEEGRVKPEYMYEQGIEQTEFDQDIAPEITPEDLTKTKEEMGERKYQRIQPEIQNDTYKGLAATLQDMGIKLDEDDKEVKKTSKVSSMYTGPIQTTETKKGEKRGNLNKIMQSLQQQYQEKGGKNPYAIRYRWKEGVEKLQQQYQPLLERADSQEKQDELVNKFNEERRELENKLGIKRDEEGNIKGDIPGKDTFKKYLNNAINERIENTRSKKGMGIPDIYTDEKAQEIRAQIEAHFNRIEEQIDERIKEHRQFLDKNAGAAALGGGTVAGPYGPAVRTDERTEEEKQLISEIRQRGAILENLKTAKQYLQSPSKESLKSFVNGLKSTPFMQDILTASIAKIGRNMTKMNISKKIEEGKELSETEKSLASSYALLNDIKENKDIPMSFDVGRGLAAMIPFLEQFALTRGIGGGVSKAVTSGIKAATTAQKIGRGTLALVSGGVAQTPAMPMMYSEYGLQRAGVIREGEEGFEALGTTKPAKAALKAFGNTAAEVTGERLGEMLLKAGPVKKFADKLSKKTPKAVKSFNKKLDKIGYQGVPMEILEEQFTGLIQAPINNDWSFFQNFPNREQLTTALVVAGMGTGMGAANLATRGASSVQRRIYENRVDKNFKKAESDLVATMEDSEAIDIVKQVGEEIEKGNVTSVPDALNTIQDAYPDMTTPQKKSALNYLIRRAQVDGLNKYKEAEQQTQQQKTEDVEQAKEQIDQQIKQEVTEEQQPSYKIGDQTFNDRQQFIAEVEKYRGQQNVPEISVQNDNVAADRATRILKEGLEQQQKTEEDYAREDETQAEETSRQERTDRGTEEEVRVRDYAEEDRLETQQEEGGQEVQEEIRGQEEVELGEEQQATESLSRVLKSEPENTFTRPIQIEGQQTGEVTIEKGENQWSVKRVDVEEEQQGKGYGKQAYRQLNREAQKEGKELVSDRADKINDNAKNLWESLIRSGEAKKEGNRYKMLPEQQQASQQTQRQQTQRQQTQRQQTEETVSQKLQDFSTEQGFENIHQALNSVRKNVRSDATAENITQQEISQAAQQSETIQQKKQQAKKKGLSFENVSDKNLKSEITSTIESLPEGQNPANVARAYAKVEGRLNKKDQQDIKSRLKQKQEAYKQRQSQLEREGIEATLEEPVAEQVEKAKETTPETRQVDQSVNEIQQKVKKRKLSQPKGMGAMLSGENTEAIWDEIQGNIEGSLEQGQSVSQAINETIEDARNKPWYKRLKKKKDFEEQLQTHLADNLFGPRIARSDLKRIRKQAAKQEKNQLKDVKNRALAYGRAVFRMAKGPVTKQDTQAIISAINKSNTYKTLNNQLSKFNDILDRIQFKEEVEQLKKARKNLTKKALKAENNPYGALQETAEDFSRLKPRQVFEYGGQEIFDEYKKYLSAISKSTPKLPQGKTVRDFSEFVSNLQEKIDGEINKNLVDEATTQQVFDQYDDIVEEIRQNNQYQNQRRDDNNKLEEEPSADQIAQEIERRFDLHPQQAKKLQQKAQRQEQANQKKLQNIENLTSKVEQHKDEGMSKEDIIGQLQQDFDAIESREEAEEIYNKTQEFRRETLRETQQTRDNTQINEEDFSKDQMEIVRSLMELTDGDLAIFSSKELRTLQSTYDAIEQGWLNGVAFKRFVAKKQAYDIATTIKPTVAQTLKVNANHYLDGIRRLFGKEKTQTKEQRLADAQRKAIDKQISRIRNTELYKIDEAMRSLGDRPVYNSLVKPISSALERAEQYRDIAKEASAMLKSIQNSRKGKKSLFDSNVLIEMYMQQRQANMNDMDGDAVGRMWEETKKKGREIYKHDEEIRQIDELYGRLKKKKDGSIDMDHFWNEVLTKPERDFINFQIDTYKNDLSQKLSHVQRFVRGGAYEAIPGYAKRNSFMEMTQESNDPLSDMMTGSQVPGKPSARSGASFRRTAQYPAIKFDNFGNFENNLRDVYYDYHVTPELVRTFKTFTELRNQMEPTNKTGELERKKREVVESIRREFESIIQGHLRNQKGGLSNVEKMIRTIERQAYMSTLAGISRPVSEFVSNLSTALLYDAKSFMAGLEYTNRDFSAVLRETGSALRNRMGRDTVDLEQADRQNSEMMADAKLRKSTVEKITDFSEFNPVSKVKHRYGKWIVTSADRVLSSAFWKGKFLREFENRTGEKFDIDKFEENESYRNKHKEAIQQASNDADFDTSILVNTSSNFESLVRLTQMDPKQRRNLVNQVQYFVFRFAKNEYTSSVKALRSMIGRNELAPEKGARLLGGLMLRQMIYNMGMQGTYIAAKSALTGDWDDWDDFWKRKGDWEGIGREILGAGLMLGMGKFRNVIRSGMAWMLEEINQRITDKLRANPYNSFHDSMVFNPLRGDLTKSKNLAEGTGAWSHYLTPLMDGIEMWQQDRTDSEKSIQAAKITAMVMDGLVGMPGYKNLKSFADEIQRNQNPYWSSVEAINEATEDNTKGVVWLDSKLREIHGKDYEGSRRTQFLKSYHASNQLKGLHDSGLISKKAYERFRTDLLTMNTGWDNKEKAEYIAKLEDEIGTTDLRTILSILVQKRKMVPGSDSKYSIISRDLAHEINLKTDFNLPTQ